MGRKLGCRVHCGERNTVCHTILSEEGEIKPSENIYQSYTIRVRMAEATEEGEKIKDGPRPSQNPPGARRTSTHARVFAHSSSPITLSPPDVSTFMASTSSTLKQYQFPKSPRKTPWPTIAGLESFLRRLLVRYAMFCGGEMFFGGRIGEKSFWEKCGRI